MSVLDLPILKLNKNWAPMESKTVRDAMKQLISEKAKVLDPDTYQLFAFVDWMKQSIGEKDMVIRTPSASIKVPEIIIVNEFDEDPAQKQKVIYNRRNIWRRDGGVCQYCLEKLRGDDWEIDHLKPRSRGGKSCFENCVLSCTKCNRQKADRTPEEAGMQLKRYIKKHGKVVIENYKRPKYPRWSPLFSIKSRGKIPKSWHVFLKDLISDLYWDVELE